MITITISSNGNQLGQVTVDPPSPPQLSGDLGWLNLNQSVLAHRLGTYVMLTEDPVEWALGLPEAYPSRNLDVAISKSSSNRPGAAPSESTTTPPQFGQPAAAPQFGQSTAPPQFGQTAAPGFAPFQPQAFPSYPAGPQLGLAAASVQRQMFAQSLQLSGWWRRVGATVLDGVLIAIPVSFLRLVISPKASDPSAFALLQLVYLVVFCAYYMLTMSRSGVHNGQTFGKQALEIRVVRDDGAEIGIWFALLRELVYKSLLAIITVGIYGFLDDLWPLADGSRRALHDHLAQTHVVREWVDASKHGHDYAPYRNRSAASPPTNGWLIAMFVAMCVLFGLMMIGLIVAIVHGVHDSSTVMTITTFNS